MRLLAVLLPLLLAGHLRSQSAPTEPACHCFDISSKPVCLTDKQMSSHVTHVEMDSDRMGNHVNVKGIAVFRLVFGEDGRVVCAEVISGHPLAIPLLVSSLRRWEFKPYIQGKTLKPACGRLRLKFSIVENQSAVEVASQ